MSGRFTELIQDLHIFLADLRTFLNPKTAVAGLTVCWDEIRHDRNQRAPLLLTMAVHLGAFIFAVFGPMIIHSVPTIPEVYTVELYQAVEQPPVVEKVVVKQEVIVTPKVIVTPPPKAVPPVIKTAAVSLNPLKKRLAKENEEREKEKRQQALLKNRMEQVKLDFIKDQADKDARKAANTAVSKISDLYRKEKQYSDIQSTNTPVVQSMPSATPTDSQQRARELEAIDRYKAILVQHIDKFWQLPELKDWSDDLECVMIINVNRDGSVVSSYFKKRSDDQRFNQYVKKAVESAIPFPPFPLDLPQESDEIYVTFYPGGLL